MTDPATPEAVKEAIKNQGILLGQHENMLHGILDSLQTLTQQLHHLSTHLPSSTSSASEASAPAPVSSSPEPPAPSQIPSSVREPFVPVPEPYSGDLGSCSQFLLKCSLVFELQPSSYPSDKAKIAFIVNLLRGRAAKWATALWSSSSSVLSSFEVFSSELKKVFDHPVRGREATRRLLTLTQGSQSVANYSIEFRILARECGWDESALMGIYQKGLSESLKDELAVRDEPASLEELISLSIRLDNRLRERARERVGKPQRLVPLVDTPPTSPVAAATASGLPPSSPGETEEPMQLGRAHLDPQERQRRMAKRLCIYCGEAGHFIASCPQSGNSRTHL